jgi:hypothetical protein
MKGSAISAYFRISHPDPLFIVKYREKSTLADPCFPASPSLLFLFVAGPVAKECADLWPRIAANAGTVV